MPKTKKPIIDLTPRLRLAADYLHAHGWTKNAEKNAAGQVCLTGAIRFCAPQTGDEYLIREVLRKRGRAELWNDREATAAMVEEYLRTAEVADTDLADTFGPEWMTIVGLVRRISSLTPSEAKRLAAVRDAAGDAAWDAARDATRAAARDAAWAAAVRDLIGQHGFTQEHYDLLTGPWRKTIGKLHPDDLDIYEPEDHS